MKKLNLRFRERGQIVQVIRTTYVAETKKRKNAILGRLIKSRPDVSDELKAALTSEERKEVTTWIEGYAVLGRLKKELAARSLPERLALAQEWFADQKSNEARILAASLIPAWVKLRASLKKSGLLD